jgi:hypothetical protein
LAIAAVIVAYVVLGTASVAASARSPVKPAQAAIKVDAVIAIRIPVRIPIRLRIMTSLSLGWVISAGPF